MIEVRAGAENMTIDWENLLALEEGRREPTKRIYMWSEPTISIGYSQKPREFALPVIRRPTGGGALVHGWDISFSLVDYKEVWGRSFTDIYRNFSERLVDTFRKMGINVELHKQRGNQTHHYFCFFYPNFGELTVGGKKFVACAMRTLKTAFLVHGSVFLNFDYFMLSQITQVPQEELKGRIVCAEEMGLGKEEILQVLCESL